MLPFLCAPAMSHRVPERSGIDDWIVVVPVKPVAELLAGFELDHQGKLQIMIGLVER
jgi:hypothetical protein